MPRKRKTRVRPGRTKVITSGRKMGGARLVRDGHTFEFYVRFPPGHFAMSGYRKAARHFGLHTLEDPSFEGTDAYRMFVDASATRLGAVATALQKACELDDGDDLDPVEDWVIQHPELNWFSHDWKHWDPEDDEGVLDELGWKRAITPTKSGCKVTLTLRRGVRRGRGRVPRKKG